MATRPTASAAEAPSSRRLGTYTALLRGYLHELERKNPAQGGGGRAGALLRGYLHELEREGRTRLTMQTRTRAALRGSRQGAASAMRLLFYFGLLYTLSVPALAWVTP